MPRTLTTLPWDRPLLAQAVEFFARGWTAGPLDLSRWLVVVPTRQSGRRLREALAVHAADRGAAVLAPRVVVPEQLLALAAPPQPAATRAQSLLAWAAALRCVELDEFRALFPVDPPERNFRWALQLAENFVRLQGELAEGGMRLADVVARAPENFPETERWQQLGELEARFDTQLESFGVQSAEVVKLHAAREPAAPPAGVTHLALLALTDPMPLALEVVQHWSATLEVAVLAWAPAEARSTTPLLDDWGRPLPAVANAANFPLAWTDFESRVHVHSDPAGQAKQAARWARAYASRPGGFALGCADAELLPTLASEIAAQELIPFLPEGRTFQAHGFSALIAALLEAVRDDTYAAIAALARRPEILDWLARELDGGFSAARWLESLDTLRAKYLCPSLAELRRHAKPGHDACDPLRLLDDLIGSLRDGDFPDIWQATLAKLFAGTQLDTARAADRELAAAAQAWRDNVAAVAAAPAGLSSLEMCELALRLFGAARNLVEKPDDSLELDGWLELPFRDEPHLVITGCNDGAVPEAVNGHAFLPESLREALGLKTNAQRLARDAWQLAALLASRAKRGRVDLVLGRTSDSGDPLRPSRLLFLGDAPPLPARVQYLFRELPPAGGNVAWRRAWQLRPAFLEEPKALRVTSFRDYLRCPFRFYLRHGLKMEPFDAGKTELEATDFGTLVHKVLEQLGIDPLWRDCVDESVLCDAFLAKLDELVRERFGTDLTLPLLVQIESAKQRFRQVARVQVQERRDGWVIQHVEWKFPAGKLLLGDLPINGTIDRIERHESTGRWRVLDYKTSETAKLPQDAHLASARTPPWFSAAAVDVGGRAKRWVDLQLPLYRWALRETLGADAVMLGYFNLPKAVTETEIALWSDYDDTLHASAMDCAQQVAAAIATRHYWPPVEEVDNDEFESLLHEGTAASFDVSAWPVSALGAVPPHVPRTTGGAR